MGCNAERKSGGAPAPDVAVDDDEAPSSRKAAKKATKALRRAKRAGVADETTGQKRCDLCYASVNLLARCRTDTTKSGGWSAAGAGRTCPAASPTATPVIQTTSTAGSGRIGTSRAASSKP